LIEEAVVSASSTSRGRARILAGSVLVAGAAALLALSGCGAGQQAQTAKQQSAIAGVNGNAGPALSVALRNGLIPFNNTQGYSAGGTAPISVSIFNNGLSTIKLVDVSPADPKDATDVVLIGGPAQAAPIPSPSPSPTGTPAASGSPSPSGSASPSPSASKAPAGQTSFSIEIGSGDYVVLTPDNGTYLQIVGLQRAFTSGDRLPVKFTFDDGTTSTLVLPVGPATNAVPRNTPVLSPNNAGE
jgi:hypothetical protein